MSYHKPIPVLEQAASPVWMCLQLAFTSLSLSRYCVTSHRRNALSRGLNQNALAAPKDAGRAGKLGLKLTYRSDWTPLSHSPQMQAEQTSLDSSDLWVRLDSRWKLSHVWPTTPSTPSGFI